MKTKHAWLVAFLLLAIVALVMVQQTPAPTHSPSRPAEVRLVDAPCDVLRNPYVPPVRTLGADYAQVGYLERSETKLVLFGKPYGRHKWLYYTTDNGIKLPVEVRGRTCTVPPGCDELFSRDEVRVDGRVYVVKMYENDQFHYDPTTI